MASVFSDNAGVPCAALAIGVPPLSAHFSFVDKAVQLGKRNGPGGGPRTSQEMLPRQIDRDMPYCRRDCEELRRRAVWFQKFARCRSAWSQLR